MTVTADPQSTPAMNRWAAPPAPDPATQIDRLRSERDLARAERDRVTADFESFKVPGRNRGRAGSPPARLVRHVRRDPGRTRP